MNTLRKTVSLLAIAGCLVATAGAQSLSSTLKARYTTFRQALERHDVKTIRDMLDRGFYLENYDGRRYSLETYMQGLDARNSELFNFRSRFDWQRLTESRGQATAHVRVYESFAMVDAMHMTQSIANVEDKRIVWKNLGGRWVIASIHIDRHHLSANGKVISQRSRSGR